MRLLLSAVFACSLSAQVKHLSVPTETSVQPISGSADSIERGDSVVHLRGNVEIKTPVCVLVGPGNAQKCAGYVVLHTDSADLHEVSGKIEAHGSVVVNRER